MTIKEIVYWIEDVPNVSCTVTGEGKITITNNLQGYEPTINSSELENYEKISSPTGDIAIQLDFIGSKRLIITRDDFVFSTKQSEMIQIDDFPQMIAISEMLTALTRFESASEQGNLDVLQGQFYLNYYTLESARQFNFDIDRQISKLYDIAKDMFFFNREELPLFNDIYLGNRGLLLPKLKIESSYGIQDFINHWKQLYAYDNPELYNSINNDKLSKQDLLDLYVWKNGMKLSNAKLKSFNTKLLPKLELINKMRQHKEIDLKLFNVEFESVSAVWKVFLLHIIKPNYYPIYDQHIHRAYNFINGNDFSGISSTMYDKKKLTFYFNEYLPFVRRMNVANLKEMDEAFFAFGQFLNIGNQNILVHE
jgi:hypothetical protein